MEEQAQEDRRLYKAFLTGVLFRLLFIGSHSLIRKLYLIISKYFSATGKLAYISNSNIYQYAMKIYDKNSSKYSFF